MIYLGEWAGKSVYQPEYDPQTWDAVGLPPQVYKCAECKVRWFRAITNWYGGLCYYCWLEQFEGESEL
jgi:hypothetical protein